MFEDNSKIFCFVLPSYFIAPILLGSSFSVNLFIFAFSETSISCYISVYLLDRSIENVDFKLILSVWHHGITKTILPLPWKEMMKFLGMLNVVASITRANKAVRGKRWRVESINFPWDPPVLLSIRICGTLCWEQCCSICWERQRCSAVKEKLWGL